LPGVLEVYLRSLKFLIQPFVAAELKNRLLRYGFLFKSIALRKRKRDCCESLTVGMALEERVDTLIDA